jgi:uncharacterized membrane protein
MTGQTLVLMLRLMHVVSGVFWVGAMAMLAWFLFPTASAAGPQGFAFLQQVMGPRHLRQWMQTAATLTVASGLLLYWFFAGWSRFTSTGWARTPAGIGYAVGAVAAVLGLAVGIGIGSRSVTRMQWIGRLARVRGAPTAEQAAEMQRLQARAGTAFKAAASLLLLAAAAMGTARYW